MTTNFINIDDNKFNNIIVKFKELQFKFYNEFKVKDIFSNSKFFEMLIASYFGHKMIPGHSGTKDACDSNGNEIEYKHFKELSSNHSWTFNDYSDNTIKSLNNCKSVIFAHINDEESLGYFDWYIEVPGRMCSEYLHKRTTSLLELKPKGKVNNRKMINLSPKQLCEDLGLTITKTEEKKDLKKYDSYVYSIFQLNEELESITKVKNALTSNKLWEILVSIKLHHNVNSEQGGRAGAHDAFDEDGNFYEYKVSKSRSWNFQDISENVLQKYYNDNKIILAVVDKDEYKINEIYEADPKLVVPLLREKLDQKYNRFQEKGKSIRRLQVSLSFGDLKKINAKIIFSGN